MSDWDSFETFLADVEQLDDAKQRQDLVNALLRQRSVWPWIDGNRATFVFSKMGTQRAALNLDTIKADPPFAPMKQLEGTSLWYVSRDFEPDDLLDYMLAIDDPMTSLALEPNLVERVSKYWQPDPLNPLKLQTAQIDVSVLRMPQARPFPDWAAMESVRRGTINEHSLDSQRLGFEGRSLWVYTPPGYQPERSYPLLILADGNWCTGPLQVPLIADALIKHGRLQPLVIAMMQSGSQEQRAAEFISNDRYVLFVLAELLPFIEQHYNIDSLNVGIGGVGIGALASAHVMLNSYGAFSRLIMLSPPLQGQNRTEESLQHYRRRFETAAQLPARIFQSVGRYEAFTRFLKPGRRLADAIRKHPETALQFIETGSGHGLVAFKAILPEALAWTFPVGSL